MKLSIKFIPEPTVIGDFINAPQVMHQVTNHLLEDGWQEELTTSETVQGRVKSVTVIFSKQP